MAIYIIIITALFMLPAIPAIAFMLPGIPYLFIVAVIYGFVDHFSHLSPKELLILGIIAVFSVIIDQLAGILGAHYGGARGKTFLFAIAGAILGTIVFPLFGGFVGLFAGILIGELIRKRTHAQAVKAATVGVIGTITGIIVNIILAILFIILFLVFVI